MMRSVMSICVWTHRNIHILTKIKLAVDLRSSASSPKAALFSARRRIAPSSAANTLICTASCLVDLVSRMHSAKCSIIWVRCRTGTQGNIRAKSSTAESITATLTGSGPHGLTPEVAIEELAAEEADVPVTLQ